MHIDYWFMRDRPGGELVAVATVKDDKTKMFRARVVPGKGNVEGAAAAVARDIKLMGYNGDIAIKCDQEAAIIDLANAVAKLRGNVGTRLEYAKTRDSQSNGTAERAVQSVEGMTRTLKLALEKRLGETISCTHPLMLWVVEHAADVLNKFLVSADGRTAYERMRGKAYKSEVFEFG